MDSARPGPGLLVEPGACRAGPAPGHWLASWRIENPNPEPVELLATWLPHGRFRGEQQVLSRPIGLGPGESATLELPVACGEPPGTVVENAFLILRLRWQSRPWRIFARHRIEFGGEQPPRPRPVCEVITAQPIGFSAG
jgi:hypothetical protein